MVNVSNSMMTYTCTEHEPCNKHAPCTTTTHVTQVHDDHISAHNMNHILQDVHR
jgi:hypothetical protein